MSQEHEPQDGIKPEPSPFEPSFQPGTVPQITVPDLPDDVQGLSVEALSQVPTLTELVEIEEEKEETEAEGPSEPELEPAVEGEEQAEPVLELVAEEIQEPPSQADTWAQELQVRMGKLSDDIHTLNARLDGLEKLINTKV